MKKDESIIGKKFGKLTVLDEIKSGIITKDGHKHLKCICECGKITYPRKTAVIHGYTKSCGCLDIEKSKEKNTKHGFHNTRIHGLWEGMKIRCYQKNTENYKNYGGRGITICQEWKDNFQAFYDWAINNGYSDNLTIDRININGNYEPSNCRWVTMKEQSRNKRSNKFITYNNETHCITEWAEKIGISCSSLKKRIDKYDIEIALNTPKLKKEEKRVSLIKKYKQLTFQKGQTKQ